MFPTLVVSTNPASSSEPDVEDVPETPVPAYSPGIPSHANGCSLPPEPTFLYNFSQTYQDPSSKFSHGTLGRNFSRAQSAQLPEGVPRSASIARIAPIPRAPVPWDHSELHKPVSVGYLTWQELTAN